MRQRSWARTCLAVSAVLCAAAAAGQATAAPADGSTDRYRTAEDAKRIIGSRDSSDVEELRPGVHTDSIGPGEQLYYGVRLDSQSSAFVSAVALPEPGGAVAYGDGIEVRLESMDGTECGSGDAFFGTGQQARPIGDHATRLIATDGLCQQEGPYFFVVERTSGRESEQKRWPIEIQYLSEPGLAGAASTAPPTGWNASAPALHAGRGETRRGGTGFNDARALGDGNWKDELKPGETRFYRIPLDWGQQLSGSVELANAPALRNNGFAATGLSYELYNTARGLVDRADTGYGGRQESATVGPTPPIAYGNRFATSQPDAAAMPFAGWYYLAVSVNPRVAEFTEGAIPLTLRLTVDGEPKPGPGYAGDAFAAGFGVTEDDREAAEQGRTAPEGARRSDALRVVGVAGLGTGTALLLGLAAWTLAARRGAAAGTPRGTGADPGAQQPDRYPGAHGPPDPYQPARQDQPHPSVSPQEQVQYRQPPGR